jgi:Fe-S-cluster containining protein
MNGSCGYAKLDAETGLGRCAIYGDRPKACRSFPVGGVGCLAARAAAQQTISTNS